MTARSPQQDEARSDDPADSREVRRRLTFGVAADLPASLSPWQRALEAWRAAGIPWRHAPGPDEPSTAKNEPSAKPRRGKKARPRPTASAAAPTEPDTSPKKTTKKAEPESGPAPVSSPGSRAGKAARKAGSASAPVAPPKAGAKARAAASGEGDADGEAPATATGGGAEEPKKDAGASGTAALEKPGRTPSAQPSKASKPDGTKRAAATPAGPGVVAMAAKRTKVEQPPAAEPAPVEPKPEPEPEPAPVPKPVPEPAQDDEVAETSAAVRPVRAARRGRRALAGVAVAAGVALVAGGAVFVAGRGEDGPAKPSVPAPVAASAQFALDPAATDDGLVQEFASVDAAGGTIVAVGSEGGGRAEFLVSADGGRAWSAGTARTDAGTVPPHGDRPRLVAGGGGRWTALGLASDGTRVAWTSTDGGTWTRRPLGGAFRASDEVNDLVRTSAGFVAVGAADGRAVVWSSADGRAWQRVDGIPGISGLYGLAASGDVLVTQGTYPKKVTEKKGRRKVERTIAAQGLWRSADGGRTWKAVGVRQSHGSYGATKGLVAGPGGFFTVRDARQKKKRSAIVFASADGATWRAVGRFGGPGHRGVESFGGSPAGLVAVARGDERTVVRSADGREWRVDGTVGRAAVAGLTVADGGRLAIAGRLDDDAYLSGVDLAKVPGAVREQREIGAVTATDGRVVAVGKGNGDAAVWSSPDGAAWARAKVPAVPGGLSDVAHGGHGWIAVGRAGEAPLALRSSDGVAWRRAAFPAGHPVAVATGPAGYVAVGTGVAWRSSDLEEWRGARIDGAPADVTATAHGYVAVGGRGKAPAAWTSADGAAWRPVRLPAGLNGPLSGVAALGGVVVAVGPGVPPLVSADGGATWTPQGVGEVSPTAVTATSGGFVVAGVAEGRDGVVFASADGTAWRRVPVPGLDGPAVRRLTALAPVGGGVLGTGTSDDGAAVTPLLWRADVLAGSAAAG
ncbi:hypothetical protein ACFHW2_33990 [Actinomadura sp. LOL_016]|uniref:hypothetical protein n=1 Tax=unclassified Actinomadura TaxID=2626254 RepID=UPI003A802FBC